MCVNLNCCIENLKFLEIFQKPPGELFIAARRHISVCHFWVPDEEPPGGKLPTARRRVLENLVFWVLVELPDGDEYPPGNASHVGSIFVFSRFWGKSDLRER